MTAPRRPADAWARYAELVTAQLEALDSDELELVDALGRQREQLAAEIERIGLDASDAEGLAEVKRHMAASVEADVSLRQRLELAHRENADGTQRVSRWRAALHEYSRGLPGTGAVDVKL